MREIDERDCQHGLADTEQEEIMNTTRTKATAADVDTSELFYAIDGQTCAPMNPIREVGTGRIVVNAPLMLEELEVVDFAVINGEARRGRFLQVADLLNPVPKTIFIFQ